jgi:hypothetical protein
MVLGVDFLKRVRVWLAHESRSVILQNPPLPSRPDVRASKSPG